MRHTLTTGITAAGVLVATVAAFASPASADRQQSAPDDIVVTTLPDPTGPDDVTAGSTPPLEVIHVETDTQFGAMTAQGTVLLAETVAPTDSEPAGWWLRVDLTIHNDGGEPVTVDQFGITTDVSPLDVEALDEPFEIAAGDTALAPKPQTITGVGTAPSEFTVNLYADGYPFPAQATYSLDVYENATPTDGYRFPGRVEDLAPGVFWTPGRFHAHSRSQRYAYDLTALRWDTDLDKWTGVTEQAWIDDANGIPAGSLNEHSLIWGMPVYAIADGTIVKCRRSQPDHLPGGENSVSGANSILVDHGNGEFAAYAHFKDGSTPVELCPEEAPVSSQLNPDHVPVQIEAGDFLGQVGNSGPSTGPHLHIQLTDGGAGVPKSDIRGLPLNFHDVFVHTYDDVDPTTDPIDWNWVGTDESAAIGSRILVHPNSCGWDTGDEPIDDFGTKPPRPEPVDDFSTGPRPHDPVDDFQTKPTPRRCDLEPTVVVPSVPRPRGPKVLTGHIDEARDGEHADDHSFAVLP